MRTLTGVQGIGGAQELAEMLRQMGRGPDTMLAHITPDEAQMLLEAGGSGRINPMTGLPEFQPELSPYGEANEPIDYSVQNVPEYDFSFPVQPADIQGMEGDQFERFTGEQPMFTGAGSFAPQDFQPFDYSGAGFVPQVAPPPAPVSVPQDMYSITGRGFPQAAMPAETPITQPPTTPEQQASFRQRYPILSQVLGTSIASLPAVYFANRARREGRSAERELREMAAPIRAEAEALRRQATTGGLTPQQARQEEARRASMRQAASTRGATTGTQQAMIENTLARERAGLAQTNLENAMRQLNLANTVTESAIRARLASDRDVDRYLTNIYTNLIRTAQGQRSAAMPMEPGGNMLPEERIFTEPSARR